ncbi:MAG: FAD-dependent oxidoreductase [Burkholderiaceae bacterium]
MLEQTRSIAALSGSDILGAWTKNLERLPRALGWWQMARAAVFASAIAMIIALLVWPQPSLRIWWGLVVPTLPLVFLAAPALWRNICPLATSNQIPRWLGLSRDLRSKALSGGAMFPLALLGFLSAIVARKFVLDQSATFTAVLIGGAMTAALIGGLVFAGKSGWCSTICPLLPVQRLYGQMPFVSIEHAHCKPCMGCARNCFDLQPERGPLADHYDADRRHRGIRRLFAGGFPGLVLAYFLVPPAHLTGGTAMLVQIGAFIALSIALFTVLDTLLRPSRNVMPAAFALLGFDFYYWHASPTIVASLQHIGLPVEDSIAVAIRTATIGLGFIWLHRVMNNEQRFIDERARALRSGPARPEPVVLEALLERSARRAATGRAEPDLLIEVKTDDVEPLSPPTAIDSARSAIDSDASRRQTTVVAREPRFRLKVARGSSLLEALEQCDAPVKAGCRMGQCGADPVQVLAGAQYLNEAGDDERRTLARSGCAPGTRLACMARARSNAEIGLDLAPAPGESPDGPPTGRSTAAADAIAKPECASRGRVAQRLVIVGAGIAGATAAGTARALNPHASITLIGDERRATYNRMAIAGLINDPASLTRLAMYPPDWFDRHGIELRLGTKVIAIDRSASVVRLAGGESLSYDKLILASGARAFVPPIAGLAGDGGFVMRRAGDAIAVQRFVARQRAKRAIVVGAGLLGIEAAEALAAHGLEVRLLSNRMRLLDRQADAISAAILQERLRHDGIAFEPGAHPAAVLRSEDGRLRGLRTRDGRTFCCDMVLVCAGIAPDVALAQAAGLAVARGILVDARMATNDPAIYAAGDVAEHDGRSPGLWAVAAEQAEIAASNAVGLARVYRAKPAATGLKLAGLDYRAYGDVCSSRPQDLEIFHHDPAGPRYRKLVIRNDRVVAAILVGHPELAGVVGRLVAQGEPLADRRSALLGGDWSVLADDDHAPANEVAEPATT